jgi:hypothetical protein
MATADSSQTDSDDVGYDTFDDSNCRHFEAAAPPGPAVPRARTGHGNLAYRAASSSAAAIASRALRRAHRCLRSFIRCSLAGHFIEMSPNLARREPCHPNQDYWP